MTMKSNPVLSEEIYWEAAGALEIAKALANETQLNPLLDRMPITGDPVKRERAKTWLIKHIEHRQKREREVHLCSWLAIYISGAAFIISLIGLFIKTCS